MMYIDTSRGVSFPLLFESVFSHKPGNILTLSDCIKNNIQEYPEVASCLEQSITKKNSKEFCHSLKKYSSHIPPVDIRQYRNTAPFFDSFINSVPVSSSCFLLDPLEFCIYISFAAYFRTHPPDIQLFQPGISNHSDPVTIEILRKTQSVLKENVPAVTPFCAFFIKTLFPVVSIIPLEHIRDMFIVQDPVDQTVTANIYIQQKSFQEEVTVIETNVDDMTPEAVSHITGRLFELGALDVWVVPVTMKKTRQAFLLQLIVLPSDTERISNFLLQQTSTFGVRYSTKLRRVLDRDIIDYETPFGTIRVKRGFLSGKCIKAVPEYDDMNNISRKNNIPLLEVYAAVNSQLFHDFGQRNEQEYM
ncbi:MAG: DUF111 family protein [Spirochaetales bacterium]|nr:DUF111 family protein [Spirochaetales bacterium]